MISKCNLFLVSARRHDLLCKFTKKNYLSLGTFSVFGSAVVKTIFFLFFIMPILQLFVGWQPTFLRGEVKVSKKIDNIFCMFVFSDWGLILKNIHIKPQKLYIFVCLMFLIFLYFFHTHFTTKCNKLIFKYKFTWVGIVERISENQKEEKNGRRNIFRFQTFARKDRCKTKHNFFLDNPNLLFEL